MPLGLRRIKGLQPNEGKSSPPKPSILFAARLPHGPQTKSKAAADGGDPKKKLVTG